jgi:hypothetical protein
MQFNAVEIIIGDRSVPRLMAPSPVCTQAASREPVSLLWRNMAAYRYVHLSLK